MSTAPISLANVRGLIVDMDGVLWHGDQPLRGLRAFFDTVRQRTLKITLVTNNASRSAADYRAKLQRFGVAVSPEEIITSSKATAAYLAAHAPDARVFAIGESGLIDALREHHIAIVNDAPERATHVVVGLDRGLTYAKLAEACLLIRRGAAFVGTNPDTTYPSERGLVPGNGATLAALRAATGVEPTIIGKPQPEIMRQALARMGTTPVNTLVVGDRLDTDILGGQRVGMTTVLVLSGVSQLSDIEREGIKPDYVFPDIGALAEMLSEAQAESAGTSS